MESNELDALLKDLQTPHFQSNQDTSTFVLSASGISKEEQISEFILQKTSELVNGGLYAVNKMQADLNQAMGAEEVEAMAELVSATTRALDVLNKIYIQNKKDKSSKELKQMDIDHKKQLDGPKKQMNVIIATQDQIVKALNNEKVKTLMDQNEPSIDAEFKEIDDE